MIRSTLCIAAISAFLAAPPLATAAPEVIVVGSKIETAETPSRPVEAFAISNGVFSFVGSAAEALSLAGPKTQILRVGDKRILPGLVDSHIHPLGGAEAKSERRIHGHR